ncbi:MAG: hypothetical protein ACXWV8_14370 [Chitinophagaceae bacterium]
MRSAVFSAHAHEQPVLLQVSCVIEGAGRRLRCILLETTGSACLPAGRLLFRLPFLLLQKYFSRRKKGAGNLLDADLASTGQAVTPDDPGS